MTEVTFRIFAMMFFVSCFLNFLLFFKLWKMTDNVERILEFNLVKNGYKMEIGPVSKKTYFKKNEKIQSDIKAD
ncbi:hypothetical protein N9E66_00585 [Gammaproteobacteria bacterium]|nr:hypothetical protein [Gammaproteobacteria bacterium]